MATLKLRYLSAKGIAEPIRFILSYAGIEFIDERIPLEEFFKSKPKYPFGRLPVVEIDGKTVSQSRAIGRYFAKKAGLAGEDDWEALLIDATVDTIDDFRWDITRLPVAIPLMMRAEPLKRVRENILMCKYYWDPDKSSKSKKYDVLTKETIPFYMERLDKQAKENGGYFVNGKLSWADFFFVALLDYMNTAMEMDIIEKHTTLRALRDKVLALPAIKAWVAKRPASEIPGL